jgi:hypothetical protein
VIKAESNGNPKAVSRKGAVGIMQVMPNTAKGIAKELGDKNFPATHSRIRKYLMNPHVGRRYGEFYLNKMLKDYNGDIEAALVAYNAGPGNANKWLKARKNYAVLPKRSETEAYVRKITKILRKKPKAKPLRTDEPLLTFHRGGSEHTVRRLNGMSRVQGIKLASYASHTIFGIYSNPIIQTNRLNWGANLTKKTLMFNHRL